MGSSTVSDFIGAVHGDQACGCMTGITGWAFPMGVANLSLTGMAGPVLTESVGADLPVRAAGRVRTHRRTTAPILAKDLTAQALMAGGGLVETASVGATDTRTGMVRIRLPRTDRIARLMARRDRAGSRILASVEE